MGTWGDIGTEESRLQTFARRVWETPFWHGAFVAVGVGLLTGVYNSISKGALPVTLHDWLVILGAGLGGLVTYLAKNGLLGCSGIK